MRASLRSEDDEDVLRASLTKLNFFFLSRAHARVEQNGDATVAILRKLFCFYPRWMFSPDREESIIVVCISL